MDNNMIMDFLMKAQESAAKQQEIAAQQNLTFQQSQNSMMQLLAAIVTQPQPDPTQQMPAIPNMQQTMALSNAAATPNLAEVNDLKAQIEALKQQLADAQAKMIDMQGQLVSANERANAAEERANAAEAQAAQIQGQYDQLAKDVSIVEVSQGRPLKEIVEESELMTGDDYYDRNREEYQNMDGQEAHRLIQDKMDAKDEWIKQNSTEEEYEAFQAKLTQKRKKQYHDKNGIVDFSEGMVDMPKTVKNKPETDNKNF